MKTPGLPEIAREEWVGALEYALEEGEQLVAVQVPEFFDCDPKGKAR